MWAHGFRVSFTPLRGVLFTFPSRYWFAIGLPRVFSLAGWSRRIRAGFLVSRVTQASPLLPPNLRVSGFHALWPRFPARSASFAGSFLPGTLQPRRRRDAGGLGSSPFARHYSGNHSYFLLLRVLRCFSSPRSPPAIAGCRLSAGGLPHSGIRGSRAACAYPRLFAACRALRRLWEPRHPPCAFSYFVHAPSRTMRERGRPSFAFRSCSNMSMSSLPPIGDGGE